MVQRLLLPADHNLEVCLSRPVRPPWDEDTLVSLVRPFNLVEAGLHTAWQRALANHVSMCFAINRATHFEQNSSPEFRLVECP